MTRRYGRARRVLRMLAPVPRGHWKVTTLVAGLRANVSRGNCASKRFDEISAIERIKICD